MESSPFSRSALARSSPTSPASTAHHPEPKPCCHREDEPPEVASTAEIQTWMTTVEKCLSDVCAISSEGKLNSDQKLRIHNLCRKLGHATSQMAVQYQSLKQKALQAYNTVRTLKDNRTITEKIEDLELSIKDSKPNTGPVSFAEMVKKSAHGLVEPSTVKSITIYPADKSKSSEETKSLVQTIIRPEELKLHVRGVRKTKNGGVIISTATKDDVDKLKQSVQLTSSGLVINDSPKRKPRIVVIGVPSNLQEKDVFTYIYAQNLADKLQDMTLETFLSSIRLSHKSGKKDSQFCNYIIEVTAQIRKAIMSQDRLFVNWSSCPVRDFTLVTRCFKCQQYGHAAKSCRAETNTCGHCGQLGHSVKDCTKKAEAPKCATCLFFKKPSDHKTGDQECPAKVIAEKRYIYTVDYDGA